VANPLQLLFVTSIAGTLAWGVFEYQRDNQQLPPTPPGAAPTTLPDITPPLMESKPLESYSATLERPLFFSERKLPDPKQAAVTEKAPKKNRQSSLPKVRLSAILIDSEKRSAVIEVLGTGKSRRLEIGQSISGWELTEVKDQAIVMRSGARRHQFELLNFAKQPVRGPQRQNLMPPLRPPLKQGQSQAIMPSPSNKTPGK